MADDLAAERHGEVTVLVRGQVVSGSSGLNRVPGHSMAATSGIDRIELAQLIEEAVERALEKAIAARPVPTQVTLKQAAEMLEISVPTARKLHMRRSKSGLIPYEEVLSKRKVYY